MKASSSNWIWYKYPWATIRTNDPIFRSMATFVVGESESKKLDSLPLTQLLCTALTVFVALKLGPRPSSSTNPVSFVLRKVVLVLCLYIYLYPFQRLTLTQYIKLFTAQFYQFTSLSCTCIITAHHTFRDELVTECTRS